MKFIRMISTPIAMPIGMTLVAMSSRMRTEATMAPTAVPMRHHAAQRRGLRGAVAQRRGAPGQDDVAQVAAHAPEQRGGGQRDLAQLVAPQPRVAGPEVGHQLQRVLRHGPHLDAGQRNAQVEPGRQRVDEDQDEDGRFGRRVDAGVDQRDVERQQAAGDRAAHELAAQQDAQDDGGDGQALDPAVGLDQLRSAAAFR